MSVYISSKQFADVKNMATKNEVAKGHTANKYAPQPTGVDHDFGLPGELFAATVGLYFAFLGVMGAAFADPGMILPMAIFITYIIMAFGLPAIWSKMGHGTSGSATRWMEFQRLGVQTASGHLKAKDATIQMLMLPVLILFWGVAVAVIAMAVR